MNNPTKNKIIRSLCYFVHFPATESIDRLNYLQSKFESANYEVQTLRISTNHKNLEEVKSSIQNQEIRISIGSITSKEIRGLLPLISQTGNVSFNLDLTNEVINIDHVEILFDIIESNPSNTFNFAYLFNSIPTPYFPSSIYEQDGFGIGLQSTDLSQECSSLQEWLDKMKEVWLEINDLMKEEKDFLGIDSSIAPLLNGYSSLINFIKRLDMSFPESTTTDIYTHITKWLKEENPKPYGLNGLMLPCLEDFELADEYESGEFSIERNIYLSLHSGLGIDTYPIGIDESKEKILSILKLLQALSTKYSKTLSVRFVSDGKSKIGEKTNYKNKYLKDVTISKL